MVDYEKKGLDYEKKGLIKEALESYRKGLEQDYNDNHCYFHYVNLLFKTASSNEEKAHAKEIFNADYNLFMELSQQESNGADLMIATYYYNIENNLEKAIEFLKKSANRDHYKSKILLPLYYYENNDYTMSTKAFNQLFPTAKSNDGRSLFSMMYYMGWYTKKDHKKGLKVILDMVLSGDYSALDTLFTYCMYDNTLVAEDFDLCIDLLNKHANKNNAAVQCFLGILYYFQIFQDKNYKKSFDLLLQANKNKDLHIPSMLLGTMYYNGQGVEKNASIAYDYWLQSANAGNEYAAYFVANMLITGDNCKPDLKLALKFLKFAKQNVINCDILIDFVNSELGIETKNNKMRKCAKEFTKNRIKLEEIPQYVENELKKDFKSAWDLLQEKTKTFLKTGLINYYTFFLLGEREHDKLDFSSVITPIMKALECEIGLYLYKNYVLYLKNANIPVTSFSSRRFFIAKENEYSFHYKADDELKDFTLGSLKQVLGIGSALSLKYIFKSTLNSNFLPNIHDPFVFEDFSISNNTNYPRIDKTMEDYLNITFKDTASDVQFMGEDNVVYIVSLANQISTIADTIRNPAAHINVMNCAKAELCGNIVIKTHKVLAKFIKKIKPKFIKMTKKHD